MFPIPLRRPASYIRDRRRLERLLHRCGDNCPTLGEGLLFWLNGRDLGKSGDSFELVQAHSYSNVAVQLVDFDHLRTQASELIEQRLAHLDPQIDERAPGIDVGKIYVESLDPVPSSAPQHIRDR